MTSGKARRSPRRLALVPLAGGALAGFGLAAIRSRFVRLGASPETRWYCHAFRNNPVGMVVLAEDGRIVEANPAFCRMLGFTETEIHRKTILDVTHPQDVAMTREMMRQLADRSSECREYEKRYVSGTGATVWAKVTVCVPHEENGPPVSYVAAVEDITRRKDEERQRGRLTQELQRTSAILDTVFENAPVGLGVWDRELRFVRVNQALAEINGLPVDEHLGKTIEELLPDLEPRIAALFRRVFETGEAFLNQEVSGVTPAQPGRIRHWSTSYFPIVLNGEIAGAGIVCEEITEKKLGEERLRQTAKLESLGVLAGGIAHDFNNLLTGILGNASLLASEYPPPSAGAQLLDGVVKAGERAAQLTRQMLDYAGKGRSSVEPVNLSTLVEEIKGLLAVSISDKVAFTLNLAKGLPEIEADRGQLQQIVMNLVMNAGEAIGNGSAGTVKVATCLKEIDAVDAASLSPGPCTPGRYVSLEVEDSGCGMDRATLSRIFDPFFSTKFVGRGLGLSAVFGIVGAHAGGMRVASVPGQGTAFEVLLPAAGARVAASHVSVLVVDDEAFVRRMARAILERSGYRVTLAEDGQAGLRLFREMSSEIDVVLLDMATPLLRAEEVLREMQSIAPRVPFVLSSGHTEAEVAGRFSSFRLAGTIQKPYTASQLAQKMRTALTEQVTR